MRKHNLLNALILAASVSAQRFDGQFWPCNPLKNATGACTPNRGLATSTYAIDFTKQSSVPDEWTISNYATVNFGSLGAEFTFNKRYDAPQMWTDFSILFGSVSVVARVANGTGMISSAVLISDAFDEIDYEMSGNNFGHQEWSAGKGQNNYFGKGITGSYDRGSYFDVSNPQETFHTYTFDWSPTELRWIVDGKVVRSHLASDSDSSTHQYPQTPSKFQLGIWAAGDPSSNQGTRDWAGGYTDMDGGPYTMYVKSVAITNAMPAWAYNYTDQSGSWRSIALLQEKPVVSVGPTTSSLASASKSSVSVAPSSSSVKPSTTVKTSASSKTVSTSGTSTVKPSSKPVPASSSPSTKAITSTISKTSATSVPLSSTTKPSTTISSPATSKTITTTKSTSTRSQSAPTPTSVKTPAAYGAPSTSRSSTTAITKQPTATAVKTYQGSQATPVKQSTTTSKCSTTTTTSTSKCATTTTTPKPPAYKMRAVTTSETDWAWSGWSNQWHGDRKGRGRHGHTHTLRH